MSRCMASTAVFIVGVLVAGCATLGLTQDSGCKEGVEFCRGSIAVTGVWVAAVSDGATMGMTTPQPADQSGAESSEKDVMTPGLATSVAYMVIHNRGGAPDRLLKAQSDIAEAVEIHTVQMRGDVMAMRPVGGIDVPPGGEIRMEPGGYHVMLIGLRRALAAGDTVSLTLVFQSAGEISCTAEIRTR